MGLFDRFKKKENEVKEIQAEAQEVAEDTLKVTEEAQEAAENALEVTEEALEVAQEGKEEKAPEGTRQALQNNPLEAEILNDGRRFTLLVENAKQLSEEEGIMIAGNLFGSLQLGDEVFMILPNHVVKMSRIDAIEISEGQNADCARDQKVVLQFKEIKDINQVPRYTVITSIRPQNKPSVDTSVENPHLLGLSMDYPRLNKDPRYMNLLIYEICHAYFLVPARVTNNPVKNEDGTSTFKQDTQVHFPGIKDPANAGKSAFTVFTDWMALANWKNLFDEKHPPKAIIMRFADVVNVSNGSSVVINPFGPTSILLTADIIKKITQLEGYKEEFLMKKK